METSLLAISFLLIAIFGIAVFVMSISYRKLLKQVSHLQKENIYMKFHMQEKGLERVNQAREKAMGIIAAASAQAQEILTQAELLTSDTNNAAKQQLEELTKKQKATLDKSAEELHATFTDVINQVKEQDINLFKNITKDIESITLKEVQTFEQQLTQQTVGVQKTVESRVEEAYAKAHQEIEAYKKEKMAAVDRHMYEIVQLVAKDVISENLTMELHQELVRTSLKKWQQEQSGQHV